MSEPIVDRAITIEVNGLSLTLRARPTAADVLRMISGPERDPQDVALALEVVAETLSGSLPSAAARLRPVLEEFHAEVECALLEASLAEKRSTPARRKRR